MRFRDKQIHLSKMESCNKGTGTNINIPSVPAPGATYTQVVPGAPFQFSESFFGAGLTRETFIERETTIDSVTNSTSVFTQ